MKFSFKDLNYPDEFHFRKIIGPSNLIFEKPSTLSDADKKSICWIKKRGFSLDILKKNKASFTVIHSDTDIDKLSKNKCFILSDDPKLTFAKICKKLFVNHLSPSIHKSAIIDKEAKIKASSFIGPNCIIGKARIGENCNLKGGVFIADNVDILNNVIIEHGAVIGSDGYGYSRDENRQLEQFPHLGGVLIEDNVYIGSNTCIDRGSLGNTIIGEGSKIDNLVHIAHNVNIGKNVMVIANAMIAGSAKINNNSWIAPSTSILNQKSVGEGSTVGIGSVVLKDVRPNTVVTGVPARPLKQHVKIQRSLEEK